MNEEKKSRFGGEVVLPAVLIVVALVYLVEGVRTLESFQEGTAGPSFFPIVISIIMIAALTSVLWNGLRGTARREKTEPVAFAEPIKVVLLTIGYIILFKPAGYFLSTTAYVFVLLYVFKFKARNIFVSMLWSVLIAGICFVLFSKIFQIRLPALYGII